MFPLLLSTHHNEHALAGLKIPRVVPPKIPKLVPLQKGHARQGLSVLLNRKPGRRRKKNRICPARGPDVNAQGCHTPFRSPRTLMFFKADPEGCCRETKPRATTIASIAAQSIRASTIVSIAAQSIRATTIVSIAAQQPRATTMCPDAASQPPATTFDSTAAGQPRASTIVSIAAQQLPATARSWCFTSSASWRVILRVGRSRRGACVSK